MAPRLDFLGTSPAPHLPTLVADLLDTAASMGILTSSIRDIFIAERMDKAVAEIRRGLGLAEGERADVDGLVIRVPHLQPSSFVVILPLETLDLACHEDDEIAARYAHKVIHEFAHCHDLSGAYGSPIGLELDGATHFRPSKLNPYSLRLACTLNARAEYAACRLSGAFPSSTAEDDARDLIAAVRTLSKGFYKQDRALYDLDATFGTIKSVSRLTYWLASLAGTQAAGAILDQSHVDRIMQEHDIVRPCRRFTNALTFLYDRGYGSWRTMSMFDEALDAFHDIEKAVLRMWKPRPGST